MQDISVKIGGRGYDAQDVIISGARSTRQAREWVEARYPGCTIFGTQVVGGTSIERDYSDWGTCKGPRNPHGTQTVPAGTFDRMEQSAPKATHSDTGSGGFLGGVFIIGVLVVGAAYNGITGVVDQFVPQTAAPAAVTAPAPAREAVAAPVAPAAAKSACEIWADANPTLAEKLQPGDTCFTF